jgi:hypothetical protein
MRIQIGAGSRSLAGFVNVEPRPVDATTRRGHAADLSFAPEGEVETIFSNAVFEHLYVGQQLLALREWKRVLAPGGSVVCIGLPDFEAIARLYLERATPGTVSPVFDLFEVYRYTHGDPEQALNNDWSVWSPRWHLNSAPTEWLPQLHKALFDTRTVSGLLAEAGLVGTVVQYRYPTDPHSLNIGFIAGRDDAPDVDTTLRSIPRIDEFVALETVVASALDGADGLVDAATRLSSTHGSRFRTAARFTRRRARATRAFMRR